MSVLGSQVQVTVLISLWGSRDLNAGPLVRLAVTSPNSDISPEPRHVPLAGLQLKVILLPRPQIIDRHVPPCLA